MDGDCDCDCGGCSDCCILPLCCGDCGTGKNSGGFFYVFFLVILIIVAIIFAISSCDKNEPKWKVISTQQEKHFFTKDGNTLLEHVDTKERKLVNGILGKEGEIIIYRR